MEVTPKGKDHGGLFCKKQECGAIFGADRVRHWKGDAPEWRDTCCFIGYTHSFLRPTQVPLMHDILFYIYDSAGDVGGDVNFLILHHRDPKCGCDLKEEDVCGARVDAVTYGHCTCQLRNFAWPCQCYGDKDVPYAAYKVTRLGSTELCALAGIEEKKGAAFFFVDGEGNVKLSKKLSVSDVCYGEKSWILRYERNSRELKEAGLIWVYRLTGGLRRKDLRC